MTFIEAPGANRRGFTFSDVGFPRFQEWKRGTPFLPELAKTCQSYFSFPGCRGRREQQLPPETTRDEPLKNIGRRSFGARGRGSLWGQPEGSA